MKIYITFILFLLFAINLVDAQQEHPLIGKNLIMTKMKIPVMNGSSLQQIGKKNYEIIDGPRDVNTSTLNLTALIQGFYNGSTMNSVNPIVVTLELHDATTKTGIESQFGTLSSAGTGTFTFTSIVDGTPYYIVVKSKNTIETWSASPHSFTSGVLNYDFTTSQSQAYGSNLALKGGKYCLYSGDINHDGHVDLLDLIAVDNDNTNIAKGYVDTDVNGDGSVDLQDLIIVDNNNTAIISRIAPPDVPPETLVYEGQSYHTVLIGAQYWLRENMNVGTSITGSQAQTNNLIIEKYCYGDLPANCITYGGLYQWNEAMQYVASGVNVKGICPTGWHIPSDDELSTLNTTVGGDANSLKAIGQGVGSGAGTNTNGFSVMLSGARYGDGSFGGLGDYTLLWSSIDSGAAGANGMGITFDLSSIGNYSLINKDYGFSVRCVKDWSLLLQSPNGGENWKVGEIDTVKWTSSNVTNAKIEYTTDNGTSWTTVIASTPALSGSYNWTIPNTPSPQCKVRISDVIDTTVKSISASVFTIAVVPTITITSPNGGENWKVGEIDTVKWTSSNVTNAKIEYTTDDGTSWSTVIASTPALSGSYNWTIPNTPSNQCKVRISDVIDTAVKSISASVFTIAVVPTITITSPNGGENWKVSEIDMVKWSSSNVTNAKIEYTTDNGTSWTTVIASTPALSGSYNWTIPNTPSANCKVRISDESNAIIYSESIDVFTISN